jgi:DeoR/GlpR family transcriptional regulator of sugar metabolism
MKKYLNDNSLSVPQLAKQIGVTPRTVRRWLKNTKFDKKECDAIAAAIGLTRAELLAQ